MKHIPTIFVWDNTARTVINKQARGCEWVFQIKGIATRKYDGVAIKVENGKVFRRHEWHEGEMIPNGFIRLESPDPRKPHKAIPGWVPVPESFKTKPHGADERALKEAWAAKLDELTKKLWARLDAQDEAKRKAGRSDFVGNRYAPAPESRPRVTQVPDGTYELCGPKIRGNHERFSSHVLMLHGEDVVRSVPRDFEKLKTFLERYDGEGIVFHNQLPGGVVQMAKIKRRDFGFHTRLSKEDLEMAYGKPKAEPDPAAVFEAGNEASGDDIHLSEVSSGQ